MGGVCVLSPALLMFLRHVCSKDGGSSDNRSYPSPWPFGKEMYLNVSVNLEINCLEI